MKLAVAVALLCVVAYASADNVCQCTSFFKTHIDEAYKIFTPPNVEMTSCDEEQAAACKTQCKAVFKKITGDGNNLHITSKGTTLAQYSCDKVKLDIPDGQTGCYYKLCDGPWTHIIDTKGKTCCKAGLQVDC